MPFTLLIMHSTLYVNVIRFLAIRRKVKKVRKIRDFLNTFKTKKAWQKVVIYPRQLTLRVTLTQTLSRQNSPGAHEAWPWPSHAAPSFLNIKRNVPLHTSFLTIKRNVPFYL